MKQISKTVLIGTLALSLAGLTGCGSDSAPAGKFTDDQACTVATAGIGTFASAMLPWIYQGTGPAKTAPAGTDYSAMYNGEFQKKIGGLSAELTSSAKEFTSAFEAKDDAKMRELQKSAQTKADELITSCEKIGWTKPSSIDDLRKNMDKTPENNGIGTSAPTTSAAPTTSEAPKPVALTPDGATVKVGDKVTLNYPKARNGYYTPIVFTITKIEKAPDGAIELDEKDKGKAKQFFYIRATAEQARDESTNMHAVPMYDVAPTFRVTMSDGAKNGRMSAGREFEPCHNDDKKGEFCTVWGTTSEDATISAVELLDVTLGGSKSGPAMFTWKND